MAVIARAGGMLQIPVAIYLLCKSNRMTPSALILDISVCADVVSPHFITRCCAYITYTKYYTTS